MCRQLITVLKLKLLGLYRYGGGESENTEHVYRFGTCQATTCNIRNHKKYLKAFICEKIDEHKFLWGDWRFPKVVPKIYVSLFMFKARTSLTGDETDVDRC